MRAWFLVPRRPRTTSLSLWADGTTAAHRRQILLTVESGGITRTSDEVDAALTEPRTGRLMLVAGEHAILDLPAITRLAMVDSNVAVARAGQPGEVIVEGQSCGATSLLLWTGNQRAGSLFVVVHPRSQLEPAPDDPEPLPTLSVPVRSDRQRRPLAPEGRRNSLPRMPIYRLAHTHALEPALLATTRAMLERVFAGELTAEDWDHCLGGIHAIALESGEPIGHASVVQRQLIAGGRTLRVGYVEGVGVRPDWQRKGIASRLMADLEHVIHGAYDLGALGATDDAVPLYLGRGWLQWKGPLWALTPQGRVATPDEAGGIYVLKGTAPLDIFGELTCDWRGGDVW